MYISLPLQYVRSLSGVLAKPLPQAWRRATVLSVLLLLAGCSVSPTKAEWVTLAATPEGSDWPLLRSPHAVDPAMERRVDVFAATARKMFRMVESDPRDLTAARKYLTLYLMGARDATVKFADIYARNRDAAARADYEALLSDLEANFAGQTKALLADDRTDLTIEIEVLRERLQREGVKPGP